MENWQQSIFSNFIQKRTAKKKKKTIFFIRLEHASTTRLDKGGAAPTALLIGMHWPVIATWSLSQKLSRLIHLHNSSCQKVDEDHGCIQNLDLGWRCSPPAASVSLQKVGNVIRYSFVTHHGIVEIKVANGLVKNRKHKPKINLKPTE